MRQGCPTVSNSPADLHDGERPMSRSGDVSYDGGSEFAQSKMAVLESVRRSFRKLPDAHRDQASERLAIELQSELDRSMYELQNVECAVDAEAIHLFGIVQTYFALQMAIRVARGCAHGRRIDLNVDVAPMCHES